MATLTITLSGNFSSFASGLDGLSTGAQKIMGNALANRGDKLRTDVRRALKDQTGVTRYGVIVANVRGFLDRGALTYTIATSGSGLPIENFKLRYSRSKRSMVRWSPREHWKLQPRNDQGQFGPLPSGDEGGGVNAGVWNAPRTFQRSFVGPKGPSAVLPGSRSVRKLYGPSLPKELPTGQSLATWEAGTNGILEGVMDKLEAQLG